MSHKQTPESFWARVKKQRSGCWDWQGSLNSTGYGNVSWSGKLYTTHRIAAWITRMVDTPVAPKRPGVIGHVLHKCDNRKCCNPDHLFIGSLTDNMLDAYSKRRKVQPKGEKHANAKLSNRQASAIRKAYGHGSTQMKLATEYGVSQRVISLVVNNRSYI
jgi:hypothetical protein